MKIRYPISLTLLLFVLLPISAFKNANCKNILNEMFESIKSVKTARYKLNSSEKTKDKILSAVSEIKIQVNPRKVFFSNTSGIEALYAEGEMGGDVLVNPNSFPYINLKLNPFKSIMRHNQHHTIFELGFQHIGSVIENAVKKSGDNFDKWFTYLGDVVYDNRDCYKLYYEYPEFKYVSYTVLKNENVRTIAEKLGVGEYRIMTHNEDIPYTDYLKEGRVLKVPNAYGSKTLIYVDKIYNLPVFIKVFDNQGFYEAYEFYDMKINLEFAPNEFTKQYKDYHF